MNEESIFAAALQKPTADERRAFLDLACAGNAQLRAQVEDLLKASGDAGSFLERPPSEFGATANLPSGDETPSSGQTAPSLSFLEPCDKPDRIGKLGAYEIIEVVGRGGMGAVFRAFDVKLNRIVALKTIAPELAANPMAVQRFLREARMGAAVVHDHVVTIHAIDESAPAPFLVMEFISGQSLQDKIDRTGALRLAEILRIGMQAASGLAAAHKQGLIHRDVKPANILLENGVERVKITDFGLARAVDDVNITTSGQICGTPQYMSPEQAQGHPADHRTDLFSLGSVLYTMCTGRPAFRADSAVAVLRRVCDAAPRPIREVNPEIPEWLERIVDKLMAKKPEDRFQSAAEVAELLRQHLAHVQQPDVVARPAMIATAGSRSSPPNRTTALRVRWWIVALVAVVLVAPLSLLALSLAVYFSFQDYSVAPVPVPPNPGGQVADAGSSTTRPSPHHADVLPKVDLTTWGTFVDPRRDCAMVRQSHSVVIKVPGNRSHNLTPGPGLNTDAPRIVHDVEGDFTIEVSVDAFAPPRPNTGWRDGVSYFGAGLLVWESEISLLRFELANWSEQNDGKFYLHGEAFAAGGHPVDETEALDSITDGVPIKLQIERRGTTLILRTNRDGKGWVDWRSINGLQLANQVKVGIAAVNSTRQPHSATFHDLRFDAR